MSQHYAQVDKIPCCSVTQLMAYSLQSHELQHTRLPHSSLSPGVFSNSCPFIQWYHTIISSSVTLFSSCSQFFPVSGSFPASQLLLSGGQSIISSVLPLNIQGWFPLAWTGWISLQSKALSRVISSTTGLIVQFFDTQPSLSSVLRFMCDYCKNHSFDCNAMSAF